MEKSTVEEIRMLLKMISKGYDVPKVLKDVVFETAQREIEEKKRVVLLKRDPNIHSRRIQGVYVKVTQGHSIEIHPTSVSGFGADFDGDVMAIFAPVSIESQRQIKEKMITAYNTGSINSSNFELAKEMLTGLFTLTSEEKSGTPKKISTVEEAEKLHIGDPVIFKGKKTTAGKVLFNNILPKQYPFVEESEIGKKQLNKILSEIMGKLGEGEYATTLDKMMKLSFKIGTLYPRTFSLDMMKLNPKLEELKIQMSQEKDLSKQMDIQTEMETELVKHLKKTSPDIYQTYKSGGSKGINQLRQIMVSKGLIADADNNPLPPVAKPIHGGFDPETYFEASAGSRKGSIDRQLGTAHGGYSYRKSIYAVGNLEADINNGNCLTTKTLNLKLSQDIFKRMNGRFVVDNKKIKPIDKSMVGSVINLRSPTFCKSKTVCRTCYGDLIKQLSTRNVGIIAAQEVLSLSEKIMKSAVGLVYKNNKFYTMEDLWESMEEEAIVKNELETKVFRDKIQGKDGLVKTTVMQKHPPMNKMLFISLKSGHTIVCQADHPLWIKKNPLHHKYKNRTCRLIGDKTYASWGSGRSVPFEINDEKLIEIEAKDLKPYDCIWIDNTPVIESKNYIVPEINGYFTGVYCGDGSKDNSAKNNRGFIISQVDGHIKDRILKESFCFMEENIYIHKGYIGYYDRDERLHKILLGDYAWEKRLEANFINYNSDWLRDFLAGLIDTDGTVIGGENDGGGTCCRIYTCSYNLVQQLKMICLKLGYKLNTTIVPPDNPTGKADKQKRPNFSCDIRFYKDSTPPKSEKLKDNGKLVSLKYTKEDNPIKGFDVVTKSTKEIWKWDYPVYDIKTETKEFMLGCVQNHNSFHLGGAVVFEKFDIIKDLMTNLDDMMEEKIKEHLKQDGDNLVADSELVILKINKGTYQGDNKIKKEGKNYILPVGYFDIIIDDLVIPTTIEQPSEIFQPSDIDEDTQYMNLMFSKGEHIFKINPKREDFTKLAQKVDSLVSGKTPWTSIESLYKKFYTTLESTGGWDSVHLEVILANILRNKTDLQVPARLKVPYDPVLVSIKKLPSIISYPLGIAFEDFSKSISYGMVSERSPESSIEKIMFGMPLVEVKKKK